MRDKKLNNKLHKDKQKKKVKKLPQETNRQKELEKMHKAKEKPTNQKVLPNQEKEVDFASELPKKAKTRLEMAITASYAGLIACVGVYMNLFKMYSFQQMLGSAANDALNNDPLAIVLRIFSAITNCVAISCLAYLNFERQIRPIKHFYWWAIISGFPIIISVTMINSMDTIIVSLICYVIASIYFVKRGPKMSKEEINQHKILRIIDQQGEKKKASK